MKKYIIFLLSITFILSCSKEQLIENEQTELNLKDVVNNFTNEYAYFENDAVMSSFLKKYNSLKDDEKVEIINLLKYKTVEQKLDEYYEMMNSTETEEQFVEIINKSKGLLTIDLNEYGEKEVYETGLSLHSIKPFLNSDMIIKVGDSYQKYVNKYLVKDDSYNNLNNFKFDINSIGNEKLDVVKVVKILNTSTTQIQQRNDVNIPFSWTISNTNGSCRHHRKLTMEVSISEDTHNTYNEYFRNASLVAKRKGVFCIWYKYKTQLVWTNYDMTYLSEGDDGAVYVRWLKPWWECSSCKSKEYKESIASVPVPLELVYDWVNVKSHIYSTGTGPYAIDHNF